MYPIVVYHEQAGQPPTCLRGLERYAQRVGRSALTGRFQTASQMREWLWAQPVLLDDGRGETERGCSPEQRSRVWPKDGLNCWEATAHWLGWHMHNQSPIEAHLFDTYINGQRHVFPAARYLDDEGVPQAIVLQPPPGWQTRATVRSTPGRLAQALGELPPPLRLVRSKEYAFYEDPESFITEVGGDKFHAYQGLLPESVLQRVPAVWRTRSIKFYPTANGDLLFEAIEPSFLGGTAYVIRVPAWALDGAGGGNSSQRGGLPPGAPPANCVSGEQAPFGWARGLKLGGQYEDRGAGGQVANAWYNDLLGGTHYVGDKVLRAFGLGGVSDTLADAEGDALPDYARTDEQRRIREQERKAEQGAQPAAEATTSAADQRAAQMKLAAERYRQQQEDRRRSDAELELAAARKLAELRGEVDDTSPLGSKSNPIFRLSGGNL
mgnify:CR=1 FL=1